MRWPHGGLSLRTRITAAFVLIVIGGASVSTLIGSRIITNTLLEQARIRVRHGIQSARIIYADALAQTKAAVEDVASAEPVVNAILGGESDTLLETLQTARERTPLGFLGVLDKKAWAAGRDARAGDDAVRDNNLAVFAAQALGGSSVVATELVDRQVLGALNPSLYDQATVPIRESPLAEPDRAHELTAGLTLVAAAPVRVRGEVVGVIYGGQVLNKTVGIVDQIKALVFGTERFRSVDIGTATILATDVRIATNVMLPSAERAVGTRASAVVKETVLDRGQPFYDRAFVVNEWYVSAYEPLKNSRGEVVGMLYVGARELPYLAARTDVMLTFLLVAAAGVLIVLGLTYLITRTMVRPLEDLVAATERISEGDLSSGVHVVAPDEIGHLGTSFNKMLASIQKMRGELQEWARTLEEKVKERSAELAGVQARMAQSEKLASVGRLAAGVAHEINNPLGGMLAIAMLRLEDCDENDPLRGDLELIVKQTLRCRGIVKGLLEFSRQSDSRPTRTDMNAVVQATFALLERQPSFHNIQIVRHACPTLPQVMIDPGQAQQVVMNLVLNAVDAMHEAGTLTVETSVTADGDEISLRISDTGHGIPLDAVPFVFEPFFTTKKVGDGTGLGLAIVHGVVTRAGGKVDVETSPAGTTFTIRLPALPDSE